MDLGLWAVEASGGHGNVMLFSFGFVLCLFLIIFSGSERNENDCSF